VKELVMRKFLVAVLATATLGSASLLAETKPAEAQTAALTEALARAQQAEPTASYVQYRRDYRRHYGPRRHYGSRYYGRRGYYPRYGYYGRPYYYRRNRGSAAAAGALGLAAGAIIGGAIASQQAQAAQSQQSAVAYCMQRFRSYDPASGTYLGYDGRRHPCP
jgi:hypothetical protein